MWQNSGLGRAAAQPTSLMAFEVAIFALPYFDPKGLIIAEEQGNVVGFVHAGFGFREDLSGLDYASGVICVVVVHPGCRRQGIGTELVRRAEQYLRDKGAMHIQFGQSRHRDPFYLGIHGGARPSGILESDGNMAPFLQHLGYQVSGNVKVMQRDLTTNRDPTNFRLIGLRRQTEIQIAEHSVPVTYAWFCRYGNIDSMRFRLTLRKTGQAVAAVTVIGLDHYMRSWNERGIGLLDMQVAEQYRGQGYGTTLLIESLRRLRSEMNITLAEIHVPDDQPMAGKAIQNAGFITVETAHVYERAPAG
ncbi:MAG: GNAT family N-acetyltransferase [Planctomycetaceae bacterium]|nr:GNAT family N-acetyltransferase [Planctomycetaceae bacterium]